jgi:hypothetical protein
VHVAGDVSIPSYLHNKMSDAGNLQLCIHRTRIAQQRKKSSAGISLSKTIKRQAFNKDRKLRLSATTKPSGRKSTSAIDFSLPPRTPPRATHAAANNVARASVAFAGDGGADETIVKIGGQVVALSGSQVVGGEAGAFEHVDSASDGCSDDHSVHSADDRLSDEDEDKDKQDNAGDASLEPQVNLTVAHDLHLQDSSALSSAEQTHPPHSTMACGSAAGEGWDNLAPFADVDVAAAAHDGGHGEGRIALLQLDGLLFHDFPMYKPFSRKESSSCSSCDLFRYEPELQPPSPFTEDTAAMQQQQMQALGKQSALLFGIPHLYY